MTLAESGGSTAGLFMRVRSALRTMDEHIPARTDWKMTDDYRESVRIVMQFLSYLYSGTPSILQEVDAILNLLNGPVEPVHKRR